MRDYLNFKCGKLPEPSGNAAEDGESLANQCLEEELSKVDFEKFPPKLLILLLSPSFFKKENNCQYAKQLLKSIQNTFKSLDLNPAVIGSSVAGVFYEKEIKGDGALLICLSSKLIEVKVSCGENAREKPRKAIKTLLDKLEIISKQKIKSENNRRTSSKELLIDPNPLANKVILTFMPGCKQNDNPEKFYPSPGLHNLLYEGVKSRIMITGGVSSAADLNRNEDGYQICGGEILQDSVVAAIITTGVPIGIGLNDALKSTKKVFTVKKLGKNKRIINQFIESDDPSKILERYGKLGNLMVAKLTSDDERMLDLPLRANEEGAIELLKKTKVGEYFELLKPQKDISGALREGIMQSKERVVFIQNPIASLLFLCKSYSRFHEEGLLNVEESLSFIDESSNFSCVGGFFDGEIGVDKKGRSRMTNGSIGYLTFGDEMRERTPLYRSISAFTDIAPRFLASGELNTNSFDEAIKSALKIIDKSGFPGAMISLRQSSLDRNSNIHTDTIIGNKASLNSRFSDIVKETKRPLNENDVLAIVAKTGKPKFVSDSRNDPTCAEAAIEKSGLISQYILPLKRLNNKVFGTLQIDLGNLSLIKTQEEFEKTEKARALRFLGETLGAELNRIANHAENRTMLKIDEVLKDAMKEKRFLEGIRKFVEGLQKIFVVESGHLWLIDEPSDKIVKPKLYLEAGFGDFFWYLNKKSVRREAPDETPISLTFRVDGPQIINDTYTDPKWQEFTNNLENFGNDKELRELARKFKSNAGIRFTGEDGKLLGAISFSSYNDWFFLKFHQNILEVIAERLRFLVEHLRTKIHHNFLLEANSKLTDKNLDETKTILDDVLNNFCNALDAQYGSLYLWDSDRKKYVLRAEYGWKDKRWVDAACHEKNAGWIVLNGEAHTPSYEPNIFNLYKTKNYEYPNGRYAKYIFGKPLSEKFTVEGIGLPLQIGNQPEEKIGLMTFYRKIKGGESSGFTTKNKELLEESVNNVAGLISAALKHRNKIREQDENDRRQKVIQSLNSDEESKSFEDQVCYEILKTYKASKVDFYRVVSSKEQFKKSWVTSVYYDKNFKEIRNLTNCSDNYSPNIKDSLSTCLKHVRFNQIQPSNEDILNPKSLKIEGFTDEVYIPIISTNDFLGIVIICWEPNSDEPFFLKPSFDKHQCRALGLTIGSRYRKEQLKKINNRQNQAIQAIAAFAANNSHTLGHNVRDVWSELDRMKKEKGDINQAISYTKTAMKNCKRAVDVGERIMYPIKKNISLQKIIDRVFRKDQDSLNKKFDDLGIHLPEVSKECLVNVDFSHTTEALFNLFDNAIDSIYRKIDNGAQNDTPNIGVDVGFSDNRREIKLIITDTGEGMTDEHKSKAKQGFWRRKNSKGEYRTAFGVLLSDVLLTAQGGSLDYESKLGIGTKTIVILPAAKME